jgi:hypothetical protein
VLPTAHAALVLRHMSTVSNPANSVLSAVFHSELESVASTASGFVLKPNPVTRALAMAGLVRLVMVSVALKVLPLNTKPENCRVALRSGKLLAKITVKS